MLFQVAPSSIQSIVAIVQIRWNDRLGDPNMLASQIDSLGDDDMLTVGNQFPAFNLKATVSEDLDTAFETIGSDSYPGKWLVVFFWPKDFTFVCPTEIA